MLFCGLLKSFVSVLINGLLVKIKFCRISGNILSLLSDLYKGTEGRVKIKNLLSDTFIVSQGLKQGNQTSPFWGILSGGFCPGDFVLIPNDLCPELLRKPSIIDNPAFSDKNISCLLWGDDLVFM